MNNKEYVLGEDKETKLHRLGEGEWMDEPDYMEFDYRDVRCQILRNAVGALCGYVDVPENHEWYGKPYDEINCDVHGGLTFSERVTREEGKEAHVIGFDCAHVGDIAPALNKMKTERRTRPEFALINELERRLAEVAPNVLKETYKNIAYVKAEIESLVDQMLDGVKDD